MINLLPIEEKKTIFREYKMRVAATIFTLFSVSALAAGQLLSPSSFLSKDKGDFLQAELNKMKSQDGSVVYGDMQKLVGEINSKVDVFGSTEMPVLISQNIIPSITALRGANIKINRVDYEADSPGKTVSIN